ncbi:MAG: hypothetical protein QHI48_11435 [Bacteroidota bacterium]|nr:hypothetical protein [Bacteroidota bacterium]
MLKERFDLITHLQESLKAFEEEHGIKPQAVVLSPAAFSWLVTVFHEDERYFGVSPVDFERWVFHTNTSSVKIIIDETADNFEVRVL